jgi:hypothetical protein
MGLGLLVEAAIPGRGLFRRRPSRDRLFSDICEAVRSCIEDRLLAQMIQTSSREHTLSIVLHPTAEPLEFIWNPSQSLQVSAKTSTVGPGYHAHVVGLLRHLEAELNLHWDWTAEDADETCFAGTDDFLALQVEMAKLLRAIARNLLKLASEELADGEGLMLDMPLNYPRSHIDGFVITPCGPLSKEWCESVKNSSAESLLENCREYYVWWGQELDAAFWRNTGTSLMWCDIPWHVPANEDERRISQLALDCMDRARSLDQTAEVPQAEIDELRSLLAEPHNAEPRAPHTKGIGYRRREMTHQLTGDWSIRLPGYYYDATEDGGVEMVSWFGDRTVRFSSFTIQRKDGRPAPPRNLLGVKPTEESRDAELIDLDREHLRGWATIQRANDGCGDCWQLQGQIACGNTLAIATICYLEPADKDWAIETFRSVSHPPPE